MKGARTFAPNESAKQSKRIKDLKTMVEKEEVMIKLSESRLENKKNKLQNLEKQREVFLNCY